MLKLLMSGVRLKVIHISEAVPNSSGCFWERLARLKPNKAGVFESSFFLRGVGGGQFVSLHISRRTNLISI